MIERGQVLASGVLVHKPGRLIDEHEPLVLEGDRPRFVSRGGEKLDAALEHFGISVAGLRCLDAGASTGGFTDCLLQREAAHVVAVDVGSGQLDWNLRNDPRVSVLEDRNLRHLQLEAIGEPVDVAVADLSFISLRLVASSLRCLATPTAEFVLLIKPQFEAGREQVGRGGLVKDPVVHLDVLRRVVEDLETTAGLVTVGVMVSPIRGAKGNVEFLGHVQTRDHSYAGNVTEQVSDDELRNVVTMAHGNADQPVGGHIPEVVT